MLIKLKRRFIIINFTILVSIFLAIFSGTYYLMSKTIQSQSTFIMNQIAQNNGLLKVPPKDFNNRFQTPIPIDESMMRNSFTVFTDGEGNISHLISNLESDHDFTGLDPLVLNLIASPQKEGTTVLNELSLRFLKVERPEGVKIVFLDRASELSTLSQLAFVLIIIGVISIVVLSFISYYFASWAIKPVARAWEKQQQFVADASHELRTPLTVIQTTTDVILTNEDKSVYEQKKWLEYIKSETERMSKLVADLLYLAKIDRNETLTKAYEFNLSEAVINAALPLESVVFESGKNLILDIQPDLIFFGEEERLQQVVIILLDNAQKHAQQNSDIILKLSESDDTFTLEVMNKGIGIPDEHLNKIFERFYRVDQSRTRETGGYGLGLAIAKEIVTNHNGIIRAKSIPNQMTTFTVSLPRKNNFNRLKK